MRPAGSVTNSDKGMWAQSVPFCKCMHMLRENRHIPPLPSFVTTTDHDLLGVCFSGAFAGYFGVSASAKDQNIDLLTVFHTITFSKQLNWQEGSFII